MIGRHDNYCGLPARPQQIRLGGPLPSAFLHAPSDAHMAADFGDAMHVPGEPEQNFIDAHVEQEELRAQLELLNQRKAACDKRCAALEAREELQEEKWRRVQLVAKESARSFYERAQGGSSTSSAGGPASADTSAWDLDARMKWHRRRTQDRLRSLYREPTADRLKSLQFQANGSANLTQMPFMNDDDWSARQPGNLHDLGMDEFLKDFEQHELQGIEHMWKAKQEFEELRSGPATAGHGSRLKAMVHFRMAGEEKIAKPGKE